MGQAPLAPHSEPTAPSLQLSHNPHPVTLIFKILTDVSFALTTEKNLSVMHPFTCFHECSIIQGRKHRKVNGVHLDPDEHNQLSGASVCTTNR